AEPGEGLGERLLSQVVGVGRRPGEPVGVPVQRIVMGVDQVADARAGRHAAFPSIDRNPTAGDLFPRNGRTSGRTATTAAGAGRNFFGNNPAARASPPTRTPSAPARPAGLRVIPVARETRPDRIAVGRMPESCRGPRRTYNGTVGWNLARTMGDPSQPGRT